MSKAGRTDKRWAGFKVDVLEVLLLPWGLAQIPYYRMEGDKYFFFNCSDIHLGLSAL